MQVSTTFFAIFAVGLSGPLEDIQAGVGAALRTAVVNRADEETIVSALRASILAWSEQVAGRGVSVEPRGRALVSVCGWHQSCLRVVELFRRGRSPDRFPRVCFDSSCRRCPAFYADVCRCVDRRGLHGQRMTHGVDAHSVLAVLLVGVDRATWCAPWASSPRLRR